MKEDIIEIDENGTVHALGPHSALDLAALGRKSMPRGGKGVGRSETATERMHGARRATQNAVMRELMAYAILSRYWPGSHRCKVPSGESAVCLHSPAGPLIWRLLDLETEGELFQHLPEREQHCGDDPAGRAKFGTLCDLAINGWEK